MSVEIKWHKNHVARLNEAAVKRAIVEFVNKQLSEFEPQFTEDNIQHIWVCNGIITEVTLMRVLP